MKKILHGVCLSLALARLAAADPPTTGYTNSGKVLNPINIDATNFVNFGLFDFSISQFTLLPYDFSDVLSYTNRGTMYVDNGFIFDTALPNQFGNPTRQPAHVFANMNPGQIYAGSEIAINNNSVTVFGSGTAPQFLISANIVTNTGLLDVAATGLLSIIGSRLDLRFGNINVENLAQLNAAGLAGVGVLAPGEFDRDWGVGRQTNVLNTNTFVPLIPAPPVYITPTHIVTNISGTKITQQLELQNTVVAAYTNLISDSNIVTQVIFVGDSLGQVSVIPSFELSGDDFQIAAVQWQGITLDNSGKLVTNNLFLFDEQGLLDGVGAFTNSTSPTGVALIVPSNYVFSSSFDTNFLTPGNVTFSNGLFSNAFPANGRLTNSYTALGVDMAVVTSQPDPAIIGSTFSNVSGRLEITANQTLDLTGATLNAANFFNLSAVDFTGNLGALLSFPRASFNLGNTNGRLVITNLVPPTVPGLTGPIDCYTAIWTNIARVTNIVTGTNGNLVTNAFNSTNRIHVLMVASSLQSSSTVVLQDVTLNSTNVIISDALNVVSNLFINAQNLTITSNGQGALSPVGQLNPPGDFWTQYLPGLQNLTNSGSINTANSDFFQLRHVIANPSANDAPLQSFVNHNLVSAGGGNVIWATYFENTGSPAGLATILSQDGILTVQASTAVLANGQLLAPFGDMALTSGTLTFSNQLLQPSGSLTLSATNLLTDGGAANSWSDGDGFSVLVMPVSGPAINSLRATVIANNCLPNVISQNYWAGIPSVILTNSGFNNALPAMSNNAPIGNLILNGQNNSSVFHFAGADSVNPYAIYVDRLDLQGGATNRQNVGGVNTFTGLNIDPNVTIYFLDALIGNSDISEKLNGANGGRLIWISNYFGQFSATNVTYPDGQTFQFNHGLAQSLTIDSDGDGLRNGIDPTPFPEPMTPASINLVAALSNSNPMKVVLTWNASAYSTSTVYFQNSPNSAWQVLTNMVQGAADGTLTTQDSVHANRFYRVGVAPLH